MDFSIKNFNEQSPVFGAKLSWRTQKAIKNGIRAEYRKIKTIDPKVAKIRQASQNELFKNIKRMLAKRTDGTFSLYNQLGLNPRATKCSFSNKLEYRAFDLPEEIQKEIKVVDKSNIFVDRYVIKEFPANRLGWLYNFLNDIRVF